MVTFTADGAARGQFVTLLMPLAHAKERTPGLTVRCDLGVATADIRWGARIHDRVRWTLDGNVAPLGEDDRRTVAAWTRAVSQ